MFLLDDYTLWQAICFPHLSTCQRKLPSGWQGDSLSFRDSFSVWPGLGQVVQLMELLMKNLFGVPSQPSLRIYEIVAESSHVLWCFHLPLWLLFFAAPLSSKLNFAVELMLPLRYNWSLLSFCTAWFHHTREIYHSSTLRAYPEEKFLRRSRNLPICNI